MNRHLFFASLLSLLIPLPSVHAVPPRVVKNAPDAVQYARTQRRPLILFALLDATDGSVHFARLFNQNKLKLEGDEFVVSLCDVAKPENIGVFQNTFKLEASSLPAVVITDRDGKPMAPSLSGPQVQDDYDRMIHAALVEAGLRKEGSEVVSSTTGVTITADSGVFKITRKDIVEALGLNNKVRIWTLKSGESVRATFLKAEGLSGLFQVDGEEEPRRIVFDELSEDDIQFLRKFLEQP